MVALSKAASLSICLTGAKEAAVRSLEGPPTLPLTCVTSACQCHQGASIFHRGISLPVALRCTFLASTLLPFPPYLPPLVAQGICHSPVISFINSCLPPTFLRRPRRRREGNHRSENSDHFAPVPGLHVAAAKNDTSGRC